MEMKQCPNGHFYNAEVHADCPYCNSATIGVTVPLDRTAAVSPASADTGDGRTRALGTPQTVGANDGRTVAIIQEKIGIDPVVAWLVTLNGKERGRDYRVHSDNNYIGRSDKMDICVRGDETISRDNHAILSFDSRDKVFYFAPGEGRSIIRVNDKAIFAAVTLAPRDIVEVGQTKLMFVPLCDEKFDWLAEVTA